MKFTFEPTKIPDVVKITPQVFGDSRGFFEELYQEDLFQAAGINVRFVQDNHSYSRRGVVRGLHWQKPPFCQGKLVSVTIGRVWDVAVDIRRGSPTYGKWVAEELSGENHAMLWIPAGFAHGFAVLSDEAHFTYKCTARYDRDSEANCRWNDPDLAIAWPISEDIETSPRDRAAPFFRDIEPITL